MLYRSLLLIFALSIVLPSFSEEGIDPFASSSLASTEGTISSIVAGHVSVISGDFLIHEKDMALPGPNPLSLQRNYCSGDSYGIFFGKSWHLVEPTILTYGQTFYKGKGYAVLTTPHGARAYYETNLKGKPKGRTLFSFIPVKGYTNCGSGRISGQTSIRNNVLHLNNQDKKRDCSGDLVSGDGTIQDYEIYSSDVANNRAGYWIYQETKQDGTKKQFFYESGDIRSIQQVNWNGNILYGKFSFKWDSRHKLIVSSSTKKTLTYHFLKKEWDKTKSYYLEKIENPEKPTVEYKYQKSKRHSNHMIISEVILPKDRGLKVIYYNDNTIEDRVKEIQAPIGKNGAFQMMYRFAYAFNYPGGVFNNGSTDVFDAYERKTTYHYDKEERLHQVVHFNSSGDAHSIDAYFFEGKGTTQEGNLIAEYLRDGNQNAFKGKTFNYDDKGNVIRSNTYGSITGKNNSPIILGSDSKPIDNGIESYGTTFQYGNNNVVLSEREDNGKGIWYTYHPSSNAVSSKLLVNGSDEILLREFYEYDDNLFLTKKIVDDGGITYRKITHYKPTTKAPFGLPEEVIENYLDLETNQEVNLRRLVNYYSLEGRIIQQDHIFSGNLFYTLFWEYDPHGNIEKEINASKETIVRKYDENDNLIFEENLAHGIERHFTYDHVNRLTKVEERHPDGIIFVEETEYDLVGNIISKKDIRGNVTSYTYNDQNRLISIQYPEIMFEGRLVRPQECFDYDIFGNKIWHQDKNGNITKTVCNINGTPLHITYPDGTSEHFEYYLNGDLQKAVHKNGSYTYYIRDCLGRTITEQEFTPEGMLLGEKRFFYKGTLLIAEIDPEGTATHYTYDGAGRLIGTQKGEKRTTFTYDAVGHIGSETHWINDFEFKKISYRYNLKDLLISETLSDSSRNKFFTTSYTYNAFGQKITARSGDVLEEFEYNTRQELTKKNDVKRNDTFYQYDYRYVSQAGWIGSKITTIDPMGISTIAIQDPLGRTIETIIRGNKLLSNVKYSYDREGNLTKVAEAKVIDGAINDWFVREWTYNAVHDVISMTEAEEKTATFHYNSFGQKSSVEKPDGVILYSTYDPKGRLFEYYSSDNTISYQYTYDKNDQVTKVHDLINDQITSRSYDSHGRLIEETLGNGLTIQCSYDSLDRKTTLHCLGQTVHYQYDPTFLREIRYGEITCKRDAYDKYGNLIQSTLPTDCGKLTHTYDLLQRRLTAIHPSFSHAIDKKWFDNAGNILKDTIQGQERNFSYDKLNHLIIEEGFEKHTYSYDSLSNRILKDGFPCDINPLNHLLSQEEAVYFYDLNGNRIKKEKQGRVTLYSYDALNRMIEVKTPEKTVQYAYDAFDRRLLKKVDGNEEYYLYDDQNEIGMVQNGKLQQFRILDPTCASEQGATLFLQIAEDSYIPLSDNYGNIVVLLGKNGIPSKTYQYTAFGIETSPSCSINPWRYASKRFDPETGLIYFGRRYFDPKIARWTTPDPVEYADGPNLYAYLHNNPLNRFDRYGLWGDNFWEDSWNVCQGIGHAYNSYRQAELGFYSGIAGCFYDFGTGLASSAWDSAHWMGADFEYEYGDSFLFDSRKQSLEDSCHQFNMAITARPFSTIAEMVVPGIMEASRLTSSNTPYEFGSTIGRAGVDFILTAPFAAGGIKMLGAMGRGLAADFRVGSFASKTAHSCGKSALTSISGAENVNAGVNLSRKLSQLQDAQQISARTRVLPDGRIRYYELERLSKSAGPTRGASYVTEYNPLTGKVRGWNECYDHFGNVNRIHPKDLNGQRLQSPHYPPTKSELK